MSDGTRTRDIRDHNQVLYQLSYTHHDSRTAKATREQRKVYLLSVGRRFAPQAGQ